MKNYYKVLMNLWSVLAVMNLITFFVDGYCFDKLHISMLQGLLALHNWEFYKRGE